MKTPLPTKLEGYSGDYPLLAVATKVDEIITYLAELTEVVEGMQDNFYSKSAATYEREHNQKIDGAKVFCEHLKNTPTPTLKETDTAELVAFCEIDGVAVSLWKIDKQFKLSVSGSREYTRLLTIKEDTTPTLKERLLEEIGNQPIMGLEYVRLDAVQAIINRLIP
jgi:hypothetical protein